MFILRDLKFAKDLNRLRVRVFTAPLLVQGLRGTGRRTHILRYIQELECLTGKYHPYQRGAFGEPFTGLGDCVCTACLNDTLEDVLYIPSGLKIQELKDLVVDFTRHKALLLGCRYIILGDVELLSKAQSDFLLKLIEEPATGLRIFGTVFEESKMVEALRSRFFRVPLKAPDLETLKDIVDSNLELQRCESVFKENNFKSLDELQYYVDYQFEALYEQLFLKPQNSEALQEGVHNLIETFKKTSIEVLSCFLEFYLNKIQDSGLVDRRAFDLVSKGYLNPLFNQMSEGWSYSMTLVVECFLQDLTCMKWFSDARA